MNAYVEIVQDHGKNNLKVLEENILEAHTKIEISPIPTRQSGIPYKCGILGNILRRLLTQLKKQVNSRTNDFVIPTKFKISTL